MTCKKRQIGFNHILELTWDSSWTTITLKTEEKLKLK